MTTDKIVEYLHKIADKKLTEYIASKLPSYSMSISKDALDKLHKCDSDYIPNILNIIKDDLFNIMKEKYRTAEISNFLNEYKQIAETIKLISQEE